MIRINLLKGQATSSSSPSSLQSLPSLEKEAVKNLVLLLAVTALLFSYEYINIESLKGELNGLTIQANQLAVEVENKKVIAEEAKKLQSQLNQIKERFEVIRSLSKNRFLELKSLDLLQSVIPDRVWIDELTYRERKFDIEATAVEIEDVTLMKTALDNQNSFKKISIKNTREVVINQNTVNSFTLTFEIEELK